MSIRLQPAGCLSPACLAMLAAALAGPAAAQEAAEPLYRMTGPDVQTRWYTFENPAGEKGRAGRQRHGRKGAPCVGIPAGQSLTLADISGGGTIRRMWATLWNRDPAALRGLRIEMYWDGAATPAVQAPFGDFFCQSFGHMVAFENALFSSPEGRSFNCVVPMPFRRAARIVLTNESGVDNGIYYEIDATLGDRHDQDMLYFHAHWRRENMTTLRRDMTILPQVRGRGRFLGCHLGVRLHPVLRGFWWGEGEVKVYLDGDDEYPTLCGTGTEDYIGDGYGQHRFDHRYQGNHYVAPGDAAFGFYRLHIPDPVWFHRDIRVTIQVMGGSSYEALLDTLEKNPSMRLMKAGDGSEYFTREELAADPKRADVLERIDDHCATAYWYMDAPENGLPPLAPPAARLADLP